MVDPLLLKFPEAIETERLILRQLQPADAQSLYEAVMESKAELKRWMPFPALDHYNLEEAIKYIQYASAQLTLREMLDFSIWRKADQRFVGDATLHDIYWKFRRFEFGYWLRTSEVGHGYMTEAVNAVTHFCFESLDALRLEIRCEGENIRSAATARRAGYTKEAQLRNATDNSSDMLDDLLIFGMIRSDYDALINNSGEN
jgi:ribosomal-protein-serine acetyltransferase